MTPDIAALLYLLAAVCFILALKGLSSPDSARRGNVLGMAGMAIAVATTLFQPGMGNLGWTLVAGACGAAVGAGVALRIQMKAMPQLVAGFHSLVGLAAVLVAWAALFAPDAYGIGTAGSIHLASRVEMALGLVIGAITFTGSIVAFLKLQGLVGGSPTVFPFQHTLNLVIGIAIIALIALFVHNETSAGFAAMTCLALAIGVLLIIPIGGADMPVVVSMLNSYSGWAAAGIGFTLQNTALIIVGALVGSSGAILSYIMCRAMNRPFLSVILGGFGQEGDAAAADHGDRPAKPGNADDAAFIMGNASSVVIVPGYGMAVAQAQHALREMADLLKEKGVSVRYAIHPVAGRMPGHMNVLLAEASVPYADVFELEEINSDFTATDVAFVIGANDITNPAARTDPSSPIAGMPILDVEHAKTVLFVKRSLAPGYAGIDNAVFYADNTLMLFGDAKKMVEEVVRALR